MGFRPIETDMTAAQGQATANTNRSMGKVPWELTANRYMSYTGPVTAASLAYNGNPKGADVVAAAANGTTMAGAGSMGGMGTGGGVYYGGTGASGVQFGGGVGFRGQESPLNPTDPTNNLAIELQNSQATQVQMLEFQATLQTQGIQTSALSNTLAHRAQVQQEIVRNFK